MQHFFLHIVQESQCKKSLFFKPQCPRLCPREASTRKSGFVCVALWFVSLFAYLMRVLLFASPWFLEKKSVQVVMKNTNTFLKQVLFSKGSEGLGSWDEDQPLAEQPEVLQCIIRNKSRYNVLYAGKQTGFKADVPIADLGDATTLTPRSSSLKTH